MLTGINLGGFNSSCRYDGRCWVVSETRPPRALGCDNYPDATDRLWSLWCCGMSRSKLVSEHFSDIV